MWTEQRVAQLRALAAEGKTRFEIAQVLNVTKNAIIGAVYRYRIEVRSKRVIGRRSSAPRKAAVPRKPVLRASKPARPERTTPFRRRPVLPAPVAVKPIEQESLRVAFMDLQPKQCRFSCDVEPPFTYCGHPVVGETSYCEHHGQLCRVKPRVDARTLTKSCVYYAGTYR